ncbi:unnamed protein product, partial [Coregonus sp. 'balchen']
LATIKSESRLKHLLQRLPSYCPESMNELWICINSTLPGASRKSDGWVGLGCCELAISVECRRECKQASSKNDITKVCKKDTEKPLYSCIIKNEMGSVCCSYAGRHTNCREYCQAIFRTDSSPTLSQIKAVKEYCQSISPELIGCVGNYTKSYPIRSPIDSLYCCDRADEPHCQVACRRILRTMTTEHEIMEGLIDECGSQPLPQDPLWQDMCQEISTNWGTQTWQEFDQMCEYNSVETDLITCLADVREPCQLGCKDLAYCTNFNNRPTELFRSCNVQSDQGAMNDIKLWSNGTIKMPFMNIPVLDIRKCRPEMSDCVDILTQCGDNKRFHEGQTAERICEILSPIDDPERCIPLERYLTPSSLGNIIEEVIHPCNPNPCPSNHLCEVNRKGCQPGQDCLPYFCVPGCKLGEASEFLVHLEARIQVPMRNEQAGCFEVCTCGQSGRLENWLPCGCPDRFVPVCARNGRTYPSACVARCMGFKDNQCIPNHRVCLTDMIDYPCPQYECIGRPSGCDRIHMDPACDTDNDACKKARPVCGHNGETYNTVCEAYSDRVAVDYQGRCHAVGAVAEFASDSGCDMIPCPALSTPGCIPVTPPGACCPLCAGMLQILWNQEQMNNFAKLNRKQPVTVHDILRILRLHISVPQCDIFGYLSIDSEIIILIVPIEACSMEAEKIDSLINYGSPTLVSHVPLSAFLTSEVSISTIRSAGHANSTPSSLPIFFCLALGLFFTLAPGLPEA